MDLREYVWIASYIGIRFELVVVACISLDIDSLDIGSLTSLSL
jgi:hypothetical protein